MSRDRCDELLGNLSAWLDGTLHETLCQEIEHHLEGCEDCRVVVDTLRKTVDLVHDLPQPNLPEAARRRLYKSLDLTAYLDDTSPE